jgi:hypothetical protein
MEEFLDLSGHYKSFEISDHRLSLNYRDIFVSQSSILLKYERLTELFREKKALASSSEERVTETCPSIYVSGYLKFFVNSERLRSSLPRF